MSGPPQPPRVLIDETRLRQRVEELGREISAACADLPDLTLVVVLKGAFVFAADLARAIGLRSPVEFIRLASYGDETRRSNLRLIDDIKASLTGRHLLVIDDIVDTGHTLAHLNAILDAQRPASIRRCVLLDKSARRETEVVVEHVGFEIDDVWVAGYGMDHAGLWRSLPYVGVVDESGGVTG